MSFVKPKCHNFRDISKDQRDALIKRFDDAYCNLEKIYLAVNPNYRNFRKSLERALDAVALAATDFEESKFAEDEYDY